MNKKKMQGYRTSVLLITIIILLCLTIGILVFGFFKGNGSRQEVSQSGEKTPSPTVEMIVPESPEPAESSTPSGEPAEVPVAAEEPIIEGQEGYLTPEPSAEEKADSSQADGAQRDKGKMVAIDAGHQLHGDSGMEPVGPGASTKKAKVSSGATGVSSSVPEYQLNLTIAKKLKKELLKRGYQVYMIRETNDVRISNIERAQKANESGADIYIRIHADGSENSSAKGASALYPTKSNPYVGKLSASSKKLSQKLLEAYCRKTGLNNRGLSPRDDLTGTNWSKIPVTLLEMGFLSNPAEDEKMQDSSFQKLMVQGMADGVDAYFGEG